MNKKLLAASLAVSAFLIPASAEALPKQGFYMGFSGGAMLQNETDATSAGVTNSIEFEKPGFAVSSAFGYGFAYNLRAELEANYRRAQVEDASGPGATGGEGRLESYGVMGNIYYDFDTGSPFTPYVGVGAGGAFVRADNIGSVFSGARIHDDELQFAYQGIAGVAFALSPNLDFTVDYRYFATLEPDLNTNAGVRVDDFDTGSHTVMVGLRFSFNDDWTSRTETKTTVREEKHVVAMPYVAPPVATYAPAPTPVYQQAPAPVPPLVAAPTVEMPPPVIISGSPEAYIVYFDYNSRRLTTDAKETLERAVAAYKNGGLMHVKVSGHTDTTGSSRYNMRLSKRRADTVRDYLITLGIPPLEIKTSAMGEKNLPIPTKDNVNEARNRRAEISMN